MSLIGKEYELVGNMLINGLCLVREGKTKEAEEILISACEHRETYNDYIEGIRNSVNLLKGLD